MVTRVPVRVRDMGSHANEAAARSVGHGVWSPHMVGLVVGVLVVLVCVQKGKRYGV